MSVFLTPTSKSETARFNTNRFITLLGSEILLTSPLVVKFLIIWRTDITTTEEHPTKATKPVTEYESHCCEILLSRCISWYATYHNYSVFPGNIRSKAPERIWRNNVHYDTAAVAQKVRNLFRMIGPPIYFLEAYALVRSWSGAEGFVSSSGAGVKTSIAFQRTGVRSQLMKLLEPGYFALCEGSNFQDVLHARKRSGMTGPYVNNAVQRAACSV